MSQIAAVRGVLGPHGYPQREITDAFARVVSPDGSSRDVIERIHAATGVERRYLALALDQYEQLDGFGAANDTFIRVGLELAEDAVRQALDAAGLLAVDVDMVMTTTVTGIAVPSIEARLIPLLGLRPDVKRVPVFGLGCVAGAAGVARVNDYLVGHPDDVAVLLSLELCSLTVQRDDASMANIVASGLFGDGAAAVVMVGDRRAQQMGVRGPEVLASRSRAGTLAAAVSGSFCPLAWPTSLLTTWEQMSPRSSTTKARLQRTSTRGCVTPEAPKCCRRWSQHSTFTTANWTSLGGRWPPLGICHRPQSCTCWAIRWPAAGLRSLKAEGPAC
jgi:3-oxoacyl-[acyl-carrier-protein] synthase III